MKPVADLLSLAVALGVIAVVVVRAATLPAPPPARAATPAERRAFASSVAIQEGTWREKAANDFPSDQWSQRDAFHGHEAATVRDEARGAGVSYEDVFRAIDDDLHKGGGRDRNAQAVPVHPRPVFD